MRILCFGDSNTYGYDPRSFSGGRYPAESRWVELLAQRSAWELINAGENGRVIPRLNSELQRFAQLLSDSQPLDLLLIMLGVNDLLQGADAAEVCSRMEAFLLQIPLARERIVLIAPPPLKLGAWVQEERLLRGSLGLITAYRALAQSLGTRFVDTGSWKLALSFDGVHFSEEGNKAFAEQLYLALKA